MFIIFFKFPFKTHLTKKRSYTPLAYRTLEGFVYERAFAWRNLALMTKNTYYDLIQECKEFGITLVMFLALDPLKLYSDPLSFKKTSASFGYMGKDGTFFHSTSSKTPYCVLSIYIYTTIHINTVKTCSRLSIVDIGNHEAIVVPGNQASTYLSFIVYKYFCLGRVNIGLCTNKSLLVKSKQRH